MGVPGPGDRAGKVVPGKGVNLNFGKKDGRLGTGRQWWGQEAAGEVKREEGSGPGTQEVGSMGSGLRPGQVRPKGGGGLGAEWAGDDVPVVPPPQPVSVGRTLKEMD